MTQTLLSLYTGAGGLDLGLEAAGFDPLACVEMDREAVETLAANRPRWKVLHGALVPSGPQRSSDISPEEVVAAAGSEPDLLAGGPPCQPFSKSGYWHSGDASRLDDPRADTLDSYLHVLQQSKPRAFLLENVPGLAFNKKDEGIQFLRAQIDRINREEGTSYSFAAAKLNAVEFGVPQMRERVFVIGARDGTPFEFPAPTHAKPEPVNMAEPKPHDPVRELVDGLQPYATAWDAIGHLVDIEHGDDIRVRGKYRDLLPTIPEGCNYLFHTDKTGKSKQLFGWRTRYWSMLLKLAKARPAWTLTAQPGPAIGPFHWLNRRLSAEELCALQTFPPDYHVVGDNRSAHRQLGNAVPSALVEVLGLEIRRQFFGKRVRRKPRLLPQRRDPIPAPEEVTDAIPHPLRKELKVYAPHGGTGKGPAARARAATS